MHVAWNSHKKLNLTDFGCLSAWNTMYSITACNAEFIKAMVNLWVRGTETVGQFCGFKLSKMFDSCSEVDLMKL